MNLFKKADSSELAINYWNASQFLVSDIVLALTDNLIKEGKEFYAVFQNEKFLFIMQYYLFDFLAVKKYLGIKGDYVERAGDVYSKTFNPKRFPAVLTYDKKEMQVRAKKILNKIMLDISRL